jgi:hypothetical protein
MDERGHCGNQFVSKGDRKCLIYQVQGSISSMGKYKKLSFWNNDELILPTE